MTTPRPRVMAFAPLRAERLRIREGMLRDAMSAARYKGVAVGRSAKCAGYPASGFGPPTLEPRHAGVEYGCTNNGSTCICQCHDQQKGDTT